MSTWYQVWVKHSQSDVDAVALMKRCDPILQMFSALPCAPQGIPIMEADGTIEVRAYNPFGFEMAKNYLKDQGFVIDREREND